MVTNGCVTKFLHSEILRNEIANSFAKQVCSENAKLPGVTYTSICARIKHVVKDHLSNMKERLRCITRTAPTENSRYEAKYTIIYRKNFVLESTKGYALTKAS